MRYALVLVVLLSGCTTTDSQIQRNVATCESLGHKGKEASECAIRLYEANSRGSTVRVVK